MNNFCLWNAPKQQCLNFYKRIKYKLYSKRNWHPIADWHHPTLTMNKEATPLYKKSMFMERTETTVLNLLQCKKHKLYLKRNWHPIADWHHPALTRIYLFGELLPNPHFFLNNE